MAEIKKRYHVIHAGYELDWTDKAVQKTISQQLGPHMTWFVRKKGKQRIKLTKKPKVCIKHMKGFDTREPKWWFEKRKHSLGIARLHTLYVSKNHRKAALQGTIDGEPVYIVICDLGQWDRPISVKAAISGGNRAYEAFPVDLTFEAKPYACVSRKFYGSNEMVYGEPLPLSAHRTEKPMDAKECDVTPLDSNVLLAS